MCTWGYLRLPVAAKTWTLTREMSPGNSNEVGLSGCYDDGEANRTSKCESVIGQIQGSLESFVWTLESFVWTLKSFVWTLYYTHIHTNTHILKKENKKGFFEPPSSCSKSCYVFFLLCFVLFRFCGALAWRQIKSGGAPSTASERETGAGTGGAAMDYLQSQQLQKKLRSHISPANGRDQLLDRKLHFHTAALDGLASGTTFHPSIFLSYAYM